MEGLALKRKAATSKVTLATAAVVVSSLLLVAVPATTSIWAIGRSKSAVASQINAAQQAAARTTASQVKQAFDFAGSLARSAAHRPGMVLWTEQREVEQQRAVLANVYSTSSFFHALAIFDPGGQLLVQFPEPLASSPAEVAQDWSPEVFPARPLGDDAIVPVREPMSSDGGPVVGFLVAEISLARALPDLLGFRLGSTGTATVVNDDGAVLLAGEPERRGESFTNPEILQIIASRHEAEASYFGSLLDRREVAFYAPIEGSPWGVVVSQAESEAFAPADQLSDGLTLGIVGSVVLAVLIAALAVIIVRRLLRRLDSEGQRLAAILDHTTAVVHLKDIEGRYVLVNRRFETVFGLTQDEVAGKRDRELFPAETAAVFERNDQIVLEARGPMEFEETATQEDAAHTYMSTRFPLLDAEGEPYGLCSVSTDITERIRAEEMVRSAQVDAEMANLAKSEFLSRMSHELRTPLNSIIGFGQLLEIADLADDHRDSVKYILKGARHLLDLINEVLDIARIEAGRISLSLEPVPVATTVSELVDLLHPMAQRRNVEVELEGCGDCDRHVLADRQRFIQVLLNLLSNALKYNRVGGRVTVCCHPTEDQRLRISVVDTGPGITAQMLDRIFTPFDRLGADNTDEEGTGLGLVLSRHLVQAMGGTLEVDTAVGAGSTFTVSLPLAGSPLDQVANSTAEVVTPIGGNGVRRKVLYIEDNHSNLTLVQRILDYRPGVDLLTALQGQIGIDQAREHRPDLILLDLDLPDLPGRDVLTELRRDERTAQIPIVVISADASSGQIRRLIEAGADGYLTKPLDLTQFLATIDEALATKAETAT
ncbi:MAG: ATP-binding protein [Acidimicrobiia bacterium]